jgi:hypothetical protein
LDEYEAGSVGEASVLKTFQEIVRDPTSNLDNKVIIVFTSPQRLLTPGNFFILEVKKRGHQQEKLEISTENYFEDNNYRQNPSFGGFSSC